jgi:ActR/RegA family two-component response regulator
MQRKDRTLLIVEDDVEYNEIFKEYCESALEAVSQELAIHGAIQQAYNYDDAQTILSSGRTIDFISLDLKLAKGEIAASGMRLLRELRAKNSRTIAIIVSGESNIAYPIEALQKLRAMAYFFKAADIEDMYEHAVKAALRYLEAEERVLELEQESEPDPASLHIAEEQWRKALADTAKASIDDRQLPDDLGPRIGALHERLLDPNTQLPTGRLLRKSLAESVIGHEELWSLIHIRIKNFGVLQASYPSMVKQVLLAIKNILMEVTDQYREAGPFIGFLDQHQAIGPSFLVSLKEEGDALAHLVSDQIHERFAKRIKSLLSAGELRASAKEMAEKAIQEHQAHGLSKEELIAKFTTELASIVTPKLDIGVFSSQGSYFGDINELIDGIVNTAP